MGALASGTAAVVGSGAVSSFSAERDADIEVVADDDAYIALEGDGDYATLEDGTLQIELDHLNPHATTEFEGLFTITNQSENDLEIWIEEGETGDGDDGDSGKDKKDRKWGRFSNDDDDDTIEFHNSGTPLVGNRMEVGVGQTLRVNAIVESDDPGNVVDTIVIKAEEIEG